MSSAREEILDRIRRANAGPGGATPAAADGQPAGTFVRSYRTSSGRAAGDLDLLRLFAERVQDYRAEVARCGEDDASIATAVQSDLFSHEVGSVVAPDGLPDWVHHGGLVVDRAGTDDELTHLQLDGVDAVVTGCAVAIADTGTIVLDGGRLCGRRAVTLLPDLHICVVRADQVVGSVPEALARLDPGRPLTFVSGPSATSDIELDRVEGVHGPRTLHVILAG